MSAPARTEVNAFERTLAASRSFVGKLDRAQQIITGYQGFIAKIEDEIRVIAERVSQLDHLHLHFLGNDLKEKFTRPLLAEAAQLGTMVEAAKEILKKVDSSNKIRRLTDQRFQVISKKINDLLLEEQRRRISNLRVLGPKVYTREKKLEKSSLSTGALAEAYVLLAGLIAHSQLDPHSKLTEVDSWFEKEPGKDFSIWLYHHSKDQKWKCLFFKIAITRIAEDLVLSLEAYVPFGLEGDPANYELESSDVFVRAGWRLTETLTKGLNQSRSLNLNVSNSVAVGETGGTSETETTGITTTVGKTENESDTEGTTSSQTRTEAESTGGSHSVGKSNAHSSSWFDNWSESSGYSSNWSSGNQGTGVGGGSSGNQGRGGGQSQGMTQTDSITDAESYNNSISDGTTIGDSKSKTVGKGTSSTNSTSTGRAVQNQKGYSNTQTNTQGVGITMGDGESIQISYRSFGIALGKPVTQHLEKWKEANVDASRVFDSVTSAFDSWGNRIESTLRTLSRGGVNIGSGSLEQRLPDIAQYIPLENLTLAQVKVHQEGGAAVAITEVVEPLPRHGKFGLGHLAAGREKVPEQQNEEIMAGLLAPASNAELTLPPEL